MDRVMYGSATVGAIPGDDYMDNVKEKVGKLFDESCILLTDVAGTSDAITADLDPELLGSLVDGMKFILPMGSSANTTAATLAINGGSAIDILRWDQAATQEGDLGANQFIPLMKVTISAAAKLVMLVPPPGAAGSKIDRKKFTSSGTWNKPTGYSADSQVIVEGWGAGGGGSSHAAGGGGGGGGYKRRECKLSDLGANETVTIGAGGAVNAAGGNSTFGTHVTAYGAGGGANTNNSGGGGGGGALSVGTTVTSSGATGGGPAGGAAGVDADNGGGGGGDAASNGGSSFNGGAGGGGNGGNGGKSVHGGGGGGGATSGVGGASTYAGNGGNNGAAGSAPAGGGGRNAAGARGEIRVTVIG